MPSSCRSKIPRNSLSISSSAPVAVRRVERRDVVRSWLLELSFVALLMASCPATAQQPNGPPVRDPQAIAVIEQVLTALGGKDANARVRTVVIHGNIEAPDGQLISPFLWEDDLGGKIPEFRKEVGAGDSAGLLVSGHGAPAHQKGGIQKRIPLQSALALPPLYLPGVLLARQLNNPSYSLRLIDDTGGVHLRTCWELNPGTASFSTQDWYFDPSTKLPVRVRYLLPNTEPPGQLRPASLEFSDFHVVSGIALPFTILGRGANQQPRKFAITDAQVNSPIDPGHFELSGGRQ